MIRLRELVVVLVIVGLVLILLDSLATARNDVRNYELFPEMAHSSAYESFAPSNVLPGGITLQPLVDGVVTRSHTPFPYGADQEEQTRAGVELRNPFTVRESAERGREVYAIYCTVCHGPTGDGRGPVVARGMLPPPSLLADRAVQLPDGALFHILARGQNNMASYAAQISPEDRWRVVNWIRELQGGPR